MKYEIVMAIVILAISIGLIFFLTHQPPNTGTLVLDGKEVCHGEIYKRGLYSTQYDFHCEDGRTVKNLTNFSIK